MKISVHHALLACISLSSASYAADTNRKAKDDPYALICRLEYKTGTRLVTVRRCLTKDQWDDARRQNRLDIDRFQSIRYKNF